MFEKTAPVTGSWTNIISAIQAMVVAGLCRVETCDYSGEPSVQIVLGDDSEVRAYYARCLVEREKYRALGDFRGADRVLCDYQVRGGTVGERPYTLSTNIYGWAMGSHLLSNLGGGKFAITNRGATLEQCIVEGCELARVKGTTLTFGALGDTLGDAVALVRLAGGTEEQVAIVLAGPARKAARAAENAARQAEYAARQKELEAARVTCLTVMEAVRAPYLTGWAKSCRVESAMMGTAVGFTLRGKTHNPSITCQIHAGGYVVRRTDFDGVRKHVTIVGEGTGLTVEAISNALREAWQTMSAERAS
jgi:hypothetical protein